MRNRETSEFLSEPDDGQAHAINKRFRQSQGDVLAWLNSDDIYVDAHVIQRVVECFARHSEADIVYGRGYGIDEAGRVIGEENYVTDFDIEILYEIDMVLQPACFWRRDVWDVVGELNQSMHWAFDWEYWMRCYLDHSFHFLDKHLAGNRLHRDTKTETGGIGRKREIAELLLNQGRFTERAVQAYIATPLLHMDEQTDEHAAAATLSPFPVHDYWVSLKGKVRLYLGPTRFLERTLRRYRKRMMRLLLGQSYKKADFSPAFKAKVVRRHLIDKEPIAQLSEELGVLPFQVQMWVNQVLTSAESVFGESHQRAHARRA